MFCTIYFTMLLWRQRSRPCSRATLQKLSMCLVESLFPQRWHLSEDALFHSFRLFWVGSVCIVELIKDFAVPDFKFHLKLFHTESCFSSIENLRNSPCLMRVLSWVILLSFALDLTEAFTVAFILFVSLSFSLSQLLSGKKGNSHFKQFICIAVSCTFCALTTTEPFLTNCPSLSMALSMAAFTMGSPFSLIAVCFTQCASVYSWEIEGISNPCCMWKIKLVAEGGIPAHFFMNRWVMASSFFRSLTVMSWTVRRNLMMGRKYFVYMQWEDKKKHVKKRTCLTVLSVGKCAILPLFHLPSLHFKSSQEAGGQGGKAGGLEPGQRRRLGPVQAADRWVQWSTEKSYFQKIRWKRKWTDLRKFWTKKYNAFGKVTIGGKSR